MQIQSKNYNIMSTPFMNVCLYNSSTVGGICFVSINYYPAHFIFSYKKRLFDMPDGRKIHHKPLLRLGRGCFSPIILAPLAFSMAFAILTRHCFVTLHLLLSFASL